MVDSKERTINKTGLTPDITVERTPEDYEAKRDPQLDRAVELLTGAKAVSPTSARRGLNLPSLAFQSVTSAGGLSFVVAMVEPRCSS